MQDFAELIYPIIAKHGQEEWNIINRTNFFHNHLGIFSIIGAKMGLRAREVLGAGHNQLQVRSFAGSTPPRSCLNDGLQISTGATLGNGKISVATVHEPFPRAIFYNGDDSICLALKLQYLDCIEKNITHAVSCFDRGTEEYWYFIRQQGLRCWHEWNRADIFTIDRCSDPLLFSE